jgi:hypothetical protein
MLTSLHEGVLLNGTPFTDVSQLAAVKHEADFCPVCPDGVCTWVVRTRKWYIELGMQRLEREANLVNPRIAATNRAHRQAVKASYRLNPDAFGITFGLRTKVRKGINKAHNTRQNFKWVTEGTKGLSKAHRKLNRKLEAQSFSPFDEPQLPVIEDEVEVTTAMSEEGTKLLNKAMSLLFPLEGLTPAQRKRASKKLNKGLKPCTRKTSKPRNTRKVINIVTVLVNIHRENLRQVKLTARRELRTFRTNSLSLMHFEDFIGSLSVSFDVSVPWMNYLEGR